MYAPLIHQQLLTFLGSYKPSTVLQAAILEAMCQDIDPWHASISSAPLINKRSLSFLGKTQARQSDWYAGGIL